MALDQATKQHLEKELLPFLTLDARIDVKSVAIRYFLEMTGSKEGKDFIAEGDTFLPALMALTLDTHSDISRDSYLALINLTTEDTIAWKIMNSAQNPTFIRDVLARILKPDCVHADEASSVIANITRLPHCARRLAEQILAENSPVDMDKIVSVLCYINFNKKATLHYLGPILANLTQVPAIRKQVMDKDHCILQKLLPFTEYADSVVRRGGILGALKNCCFEYDCHPWLLSEDIDILSRLLLPLAGGEEIEEDDMERLPIDLQYLPPDKKREEDPDLRTMLLDALMLLCSTKHGRLYIKEKNAYVILRELHKWEKDPKAKVACQKLCELLISEEPEAGMDDLHKVEVPKHLQERFDKLDANLLKDFEDDLRIADSDQKATDNAAKRRCLHRKKKLTLFV